MGGLSGTIIGGFGSGTWSTGVGVLEGNVSGVVRSGTGVLIIGTGERETVVRLLAVTVIVVRRSVGVTVVVVVVGTGAGSTGLEGSMGTLVELLAGTLVVVIAVNRGAVSVRLTGTGNGTGTGPATTD